ncbi:MerR family transcriptional regulator [Streptomyces halobius]|uniref:MerR family transcriptional regulator n=1 Tax=Streptomyces halobius TaxID=2879846 RepID=A0ABY4MFB9_9ACTN|nr:MerR family transcriptional regulator [Streptomyces halobius]UQA95803.1 MerR family transcriptional regulator [Streptomyces halobius]
MRIGELAALAGVSTRTVRHYHHLGLLPEPERRPNGYREYGLRDAVALARVRRLTELGLGLEEVRDVTADDAGRELCEVLSELDADLARQEEAIRARRARIATLLQRAVEDGGLPPEGPVSEELAALFGEMAKVSARLLGPEPAMAVKEREVLALIESVAGARRRPRCDGGDSGRSPGEPPLGAVAGGEQARGRLSALLKESAAAPGAMDRMYEVYALLDELAQAGPDDPRVARAARAISDWLPDSVVAEIGEGAGEAVAREAAEGADGFLKAFFADFAPAQAAAVREAMRLIAERTR